MTGSTAVFGSAPCCAAEVPATRSEPANTPRSTSRPGFMTLDDSTGYGVNLRRHTSLLGRPRRSTRLAHARPDPWIRSPRLRLGSPCCTYASRRGLPRASSGSQLDPVPGQAALLPATHYQPQASPLLVTH